MLFSPLCASFGVFIYKLLSLRIQTFFPSYRLVVHSQTNWSSISGQKIPIRVLHLGSFVPATICCLKYLRRSPLMAKVPKLPVKYESVRHQEQLIPKIRNSHLKLKCRYRNKNKLTFVLILFLVFQRLITLMVRIFILFL